MARLLLVMMTLSVPAQLVQQSESVSSLVAQPSVCSSVKVDPSLPLLVQGADQAVYASDATHFVASERHYCLQRALVPVPIQRFWALDAGPVIAVPGQVVVLAEISDPVARERYLSAIEAGARLSGRAVERREIGALTVLRLR